MRFGMLFFLTTILSWWPMLANAQDAFEIQVYRGEANNPGQFGLELHSNYTFIGPKIGEDETHYTRALHETLEPSLGITDWLELGAYLQFGTLKDESLQFAGAKFRLKFVALESDVLNLRLGLNWELAYEPTSFGDVQWGTEIRPIFAWHPGRWDFAFNPIFDVELEGDERFRPAFEPAVALTYALDEMFALGAEYYGGGMLLGKTVPVRRQGHYVFGVAEIMGIDNWEVHASIGKGLTESSNRYLTKVVIGHTF